MPNIAHSFLDSGLIGGKGIVARPSRKRVDLLARRKPTIGLMANYDRAWRAAAGELIQTLGFAPLLSAAAVRIRPDVRLHPAKKHEKRLITHLAIGPRWPLSLPVCQVSLPRLANSFLVVMACIRVCCV